MVKKSIADSRMAVDDVKSFTAEWRSTDDHER